MSNTSEMALPVSSKDSTPKTIRSCERHVFSVSLNVYISASLIQLLSHLQLVLGLYSIQILKTLR